MNRLQLLLADDDEDDCLFFKEALGELPISSQLTTVYNGEQLMQLLTNTTGKLPDALFLDLNMPRKSGYECLSEIKLDPKLKQLPVIVLSTSFEQTEVEQLCANGAQLCIRKPAEYAQLKGLIQQALTLLVKPRNLQPAGEQADVVTTSTQ